jgi:serine/threonine protein kinase
MSTLSAWDPIMRTIGKYRLIATLGEGGAATVYLAIALGPAGFNKLAVLKILRPSLAQHEDVVEMFMNEARIAARLNHANVIHTYEFGEEKGVHFLAMEYLEGQPYSSLLRGAKGGAGLSLVMHLRILVETLAGLDYVHGLEDFGGQPLELVHRDVSPQNVLVTYEGQVKVLDFGIAKVVGGTVKTETGVLKGKVAYMAPEQVGGREIDRRADIYAVGIMMWEVLVGRRLRKAGTDLPLLYSILNEEVPSPRTVNPVVREDLERICMRAVARAPEARYATAQEMMLELEGAMSALGAPVLARDLGARVTEMFKEQRAEMRRIVDAQLSESAIQKDSLPNLMRLTTSAPPPSARSSNVDRVSVSPARAPKKASHGRGFLSGFVVVVAIGVAASAVLSIVSPRLGLWRDVPVATAPPQATAPPETTPLPAPPASAIPPAESSAIAAPPTSAALPPVASAEAARPARVRVSIRAVPSSAKLFLDDAALAHNPYEATAPSDAAPHRVRAQARGYVTSDAIITLDHDATLVLELVAIGHPRGGRTRVSAGSANDVAPPIAATASAPPSGPIDLPPPPTKTDHAIDLTDPYAK